MDLEAFLQANAPIETESLTIAPSSPAPADLSAFLEANAPPSLTAGEEEGWLDWLSGANATLRQAVPFSDEAAGAGYALSKYPANAATWITNLFLDEDIPYVTRTLEEGYDRGKAEALIPAQNFAEDNPLTSVALQVAGGAVLPAGKLSLGALRGAVQGATTAAGTGAVYGFAAGEGLADRIEKAKGSMAVPALLGAGLGAVGGRANLVTDRAGREALEATVEQEAMRRAIRAAEEDQLRMTMAQEGLSSLYGEAQQKALGALATKATPATAGEAAQVVANRQLEALRAARKASADELFEIAREVPTPTRIVTEAVDTGLVSRSGNPIFEPQFGVSRGSSELEGLMADPIVQATLKDARKYNRGLRGVEDTDPEMIQRALQSIGADINDRFATNPSKRMSLGDLKSAIEREVDTFNPELLAARADYATKSAPIKELNKSFAGSLIKEKDPARAATKLLALEPENLAAAKAQFSSLGASSTFDDLTKAGVAKFLSKKADTVDPIDALMKTSSMRKKLQVALSKEEYSLLSEAHRLSKLQKAGSKLPPVQIPSATIEARAKTSSGLFDFLLDFAPGPVRTAIRAYRGSRDYVAPYLARDTLGRERSLGVLSGNARQEEVSPIPEADIFTPEVGMARRVVDPMSPEAEAEPVSIEDFQMEEVLDALRQVESGGGKYLVSPAGALGPYQFMPETAKEWGLEDPMDEVASRDAARRYLTWLYEQTGSLEKALQAYNFGIGNIKKGKPLPKETAAYVPKIMAAIAKSRGMA